MSRKMVLLNLLLLALVVGLGWTLRARWREARQKQNTTLEKAAQAQRVMPPPSLPLAKPVAPAQYFEVADKTLFSRDRNPSIVLEPPPPPPPPPPMPDLPFYHGQMAIGEPIAILSTGKTPQRSYHAGETVGDFKLIRWDREKIAFDWNGKTVERNLSELKPKENAPAPDAQSTAANASAAAAAPKAQVVTVVNRAKQVEGSDSKLGPEIAGGNRACVQGDDSASGSIYEGYKKTQMIMLVGPICYWEKVK